MSLVHWWVRWSAWLCLSLMLWTAAAECTHIHPGQVENGSCTICVVAHTASPAPSSADAPPIFAAIGLAQEKEVVAPVRLEFSDLGIRGPPVL